jgi:hypothetical protein
MMGSVDITSVGFPGMRQQYARRLGPDGEEADDIIGPDGHAEQLPPYSRYPLAEPTKEAFAPGVADPDDLSSESLHMIDSSDPASRGDDANDSPQASLIPAAAAGEGDASGASKERRKEANKRRGCFGRFPTWVVVLGVFFLVVLAAILGGVIGRYVGSKRSRGTVQSPPSPSPAFETEA